MNQYRANPRMDHIDMEKLEKFLEKVNIAAGLTEEPFIPVDGDRMSNYARDSYRFHHYPVTVPWGVIWTGRKR